MAHREGIRAFHKGISLEGKAVHDWGCGTKPITKYLDGKPSDYIGIDILEHVEPTKVADISKGLVYLGDDHNADMAFCLEVLEHVDDPKTALTNIYANLKDGGELYLSIPFLYPVHSDHDLWRFTDQGIDKLLTAAGFQVESIDATDTWPMGNDPSKPLGREWAKGWVVKAIKR